MAEPTKAYRVEERWVATSVCIVWAKNAEEAKAKAREGIPKSSDVEAIDNITAPAPTSIRARREPREDRSTDA